MTPAPRHAPEHTDAGGLRTRIMRLGRDVLIQWFRADQCICAVRVSPLRVADVLADPPHAVLDAA